MVMLVLEMTGYAYTITQQGLTQQGRQNLNYTNDAYKKVIL